MRVAKSIIALFPALLLTGFSAFSQDYTWWNNKHNWDGKTSWSRYIVLSPKFLGPNALPVPEIKNGSLSNMASFKMAYDNHFIKGETTHNGFFELYVPIQKDKISINVNIVPIEYYVMDTTIRDLRKSRDLDGKGFALGDLYFSTLIQILKDKKNLPDILLTVNLKTASGSNLEAARYTDTPGYFFDLSFGKKINRNGTFLKAIQPYAMTGFYVWQTRRDDYHQNDAFHFGLGLDMQFSKIELRNAVGGYFGYISNGDKPIVYRSSIISKFNSLFNYELRFQQGFRDFRYTSIRLGCFVNLKRFNKS